MRPRYFIQFFLTLIAIAGTFLVLQSSNTVSKNNSCKESMDACCNKKSNNDKMIWENLSQQFFSAF